MNEKYSISFVIPVYRSEHTIETVVDSINEIEQFDWEAILINDNSPDKVDLSIKRLTDKYPDKITYIQLHINGGQQAAIINGLSYTTKEFIATIDDDGQNPPSEILKLIDKMQVDDLDIVYGQVKERMQTPFRKLISYLNIALTKYTIGNNKNIPFSNVRLMRNYIGKGMSQASCQHNYIEGLAFMLTSRIGYVPIEQKGRFVGKSSYNLLTLLKLLMNHVIGYSNIILRLVSLLSLVVSILAFLSGLTYFFLTINNSNRPTGWLSTYLTLTILFSLLFLTLGILIEYIGRIYSKINQTNNKIIRINYRPKNISVDKRVV